jgi:ankyrin repeat protein
MRRLARSRVVLWWGITLTIALGLNLSFGAELGEVSVRVVRPSGSNGDLLKAVRQNDPVAIIAALAAGASLEEEDYKEFIAPLPLAVTLGHGAAVKAVAEKAPTLEGGFLAAVLFSNRAAFEILAKIRPPTPEFAQTCLTVFAMRESLESRKDARAVLERLIDGKPVELPKRLPPLRRRATATSSSAQEFGLAQRLFEYLGRPSPDMSDQILDDALNSGDVFYADWLLARGIGNADAKFWQAMAVTAVRANNTPGIAALVSRGVYLNAYDERGNTPLMAAVRIGNAPLVRALLKAGADPNFLSKASDDEVGLPLTKAVKGRSNAVIDTLLKAGADVNRIDGKNDEEMTWALREAVRKGFPDIVARLLKAGANPNLQDDHGNTLLHDFTNRFEPAHLASLKLLAAAGMDFLARNQDGVSVLSSALTQRNPSRAYWSALVEFGARPDESTYDSLFKGYEFADWLFTAGGGEPNFRLRDGLLVDHAVERVLREGDTTLLEALVAAGATLPESSENIRFIAVIAVNKKKPALMAFLAQQQIPSDIVQETLELAVLAGDVPIVRMLLDVGANPNAPSSDGGTILHPLVERNAARGEALSDAQQELIGLLIDRGLDLHVRNSNGETLFGAAQRSALTAQTLGQAVQGSKGRDAIGLHDAVRINSLGRLEGLLNDGAIIDATDGLGRTPLSLALALGRFEAVKLLLHRKATIGFDPPVRGVPADIDYASDPRFSALFRSRLLADRLVAQSDDPIGDLARFEKFVNQHLPDVAWIWSCSPTCKGENRFTGNSTLWWWPLRSARYDRSHQAETRARYEFLVGPRLTYNPGSGYSDPWRIPYISSDPKFNVRASIHLPGCTFDVKPFCLTGLTIAFPEYSDGQIKVTQGQRSETLGPGQSLTFDRSNGDIDLNIERIEGKEMTVSVDIKLAKPPAVDLGADVSTEQRLKTYTTLAKLRHKRLEAIKMAGQAATIPVKTENLVLANALDAAERRLSALAVQKNYLGVVRELCRHYAAEVARLPLAEANLRKLLASRLSFTTEDLKLLIQDLNTKIAEAPKSHRLTLESIRNALAKAKDAAQVQDKAIEVVREGLFESFDRLIFEYQGLILELAQFEGLKDLPKKLPVTAEQRAAIRARISASDVFIADDSFGGKGAQMRQALGLTPVTP